MASTSDPKSPISAQGSAQKFGQANLMRPNITYNELSPGTLAYGAVSQVMSLNDRVTKLTIKNDVNMQQQRKQQQQPQGLR